MSNVFRSTRTPFLPVPQFLISSGLLSNLSTGALKLYVLLLYHAEKRTKVELEVSNRDIRDQAALSPNTIRRARTKLKELGLVDLKQISGGRYTYVILNPLTRFPLPHPRSAPSGSISAMPPSTPSVPALSSPSVAPPWSQIGK